MKVLALLVVGVALVGCGKVGLVGSRIGQNIKFDPVSITPSTDIITICNAIVAKAPELTLNKNYNFDHSVRSCYDPDDRPLSPTSYLSFQTSIDIRNNGVQYFKKSDGTQFLDVETSTSGVMAAICNSLSDLKDQIKLADGQVITFQTSTQTTDCSAGFNQKCFGIYYYSPVGSSTEDYKNHTSEFLKFDVSPTGTTRGFWLERKKVTSISCSGSFIQEQLAVLK